MEIGDTVYVIDLDWWQSPKEMAWKGVIVGTNEAGNVFRVKPEDSPVCRQVLAAKIYTKEDAVAYLQDFHIEIDTAIERIQAC